MTIWKYSVPINDSVVLFMPRGAKILTVQMQETTACVWAIVDPEAENASRSFSWFGTGHPLPERFSGEYIGTVQNANGSLVFHLFEMP